MNLLEATTMLIDAVKTWAPDEPKLRRAVKRMEKRLVVLQVRERKAYRRRRWSAWYQACADAGEVWTRPDGRRRLTEPICMGCYHMLRFREFCAMAEISGRGLVRSLHCPECGYLIVGEEEQEQDQEQENGLEAQRVTDGCWLPGN